MLTKITKKIIKNKYLAAILLLGIFLRFSGVNQTPPALNWDEVSHGYNAYSILKTGKDEWGQTLPLIFRAYGDYKLPVYIYTTVIPVAVFGLNVFAVRLPSMIAGTLLILYTYLLAKQLTNKFESKNDLVRTKLPLLSALFVAVAPWTLFTSRAAFEANLSQFLIVSGVYYFFRSSENDTKSLITSSILLGLSVWTYNSARVFVPLLLISLILFYSSKLKRIYKDSPSTMYYSLFAVLFFFTPMFTQLLNPSGQARYEWVAIVDEGAVNRIIENRLASELPESLSRLVYNRPIYFVSNFIQNYLNHFSPQFLFFEGASDYQFNIQGYGLLHPINLLFFYIGLLFILHKSIFKGNNKIYKLLLVWLMLSPIASSLTRESPHTLRAIIMIPVPMFLTSMGLLQTYLFIVDKFGETTSILKEYGLSQVSTKKFYFSAYFLFLFFMVSSYWAFYSNIYRKEFSWSWQYGYEEAVDFAKDNYDNYDKVIVTKKYGEPHEFFLFHWPWQPSRYQSDPDLIRFEQSNWFWVDRFDKFYFVNDWQIVEDDTDQYTFNLESGASVDCGMQECLLITSPGNVPNGWNQLETISFLNGEPVFEIYEN